MWNISRVRALRNWAIALAFLATLSLRSVQAAPVHFTVDPATSSLKLHVSIPTSFGFAVTGQATTSLSGMLAADLDATPAPGGLIPGDLNSLQGQLDVARFNLPIRAGFLGGADLDFRNADLGVLGSDATLAQTSASLNHGAYDPAGSSLDLILRSVYGIPTGGATPESVFTLTNFTQSTTAGSNVNGIVIDLDPVAASAGNLAGQMSVNFSISSTGAWPWEFNTGPLFARQAAEADPDPLGNPVAFTLTGTLRGTIAQVPEPGTGTLLLVGLLGLAATRWRRLKPRRPIALGLALLVGATTAGSARAETLHLTIDPAQSKLTLSVVNLGSFWFARSQTPTGFVDAVGGSISVDSSGATIQSLSATLDPLPNGPFDPVIGSHEHNFGYEWAILLDPVLARHVFADLQFDVSGGASGQSVAIAQGVGLVRTFQFPQQVGSFDLTPLSAVTNVAAPATLSETGGVWTLRLPIDATYEQTLGGTTFATATFRGEIVAVSLVPEPSTLLLALAACAMIATRRLLRA